MCRRIAEEFLINSRGSGSFSFGKVVVQFGYGEDAMKLVISERTRQIAVSAVPAFMSPARFSRARIFSQLPR
jgi:hypothetical protein